MNLRSSDANKVLDEDFIEDYKRGMQLFYFELVNLNTNIFIIEKIQNFNFKLFCSGPNTIFFTTVLKNLYDSSILTITRLSTDKASGLSTLLQFKNQVIKSVKREYKKDLIGLFKQNKFDNKINDMLQIATEIRNSRIAHLKINTIFDEEIKGLKIDDLKELTKLLNSLLQAMSFNVEQLMIPLPYSEYSKQSTDIELILDDIVRRSNIINMPETTPSVWERYIRKLSQKDIDVINSYRRKFDLPEVS